MSKTCVREMLEFCIISEKEMFKDYRKWYSCPKCNLSWTNEGYEEDEFERSCVKDKYPKKLCPNCGEIIIDGRLKGPLIGVGPVKVEDFKCQVCGSEDLNSKPFDGNSCYIYLYECFYCNSYNYADLEDYNGEDPLNVWYREDLRTRGFMTAIKIILESKPVEIK